MKVAVVGATGLVGSKMLEVLAERNFPVTELIPVASDKSIGRLISFQGKEWPIVSIQDAVLRKPEIALFSAGSGPSLEWAPAFAEKGTYVVDNSSAWRMNPDSPLVVPEINAHTINSETRIIANPNCSTIQMVMVLNPLHEKYGLKRVIVSTYQSVTGTGVKAVQQMENERLGIKGPMAYPYQIDQNAIPQVDVFLENGYTKEEMKMVNETRKILNIPALPVTSTCVRIPVIGGHSEAVNIALDRPFNIHDVIQLLKDTEGLMVQDDPASLTYPMPQSAHNRDEVFVGRIRRDESADNTLNMWIVSDNLRKGAATNAVQIAEWICKNYLTN